MNLSAPFIQRPIMTTLVMAAILMLGIMAFNRLPISNLPDVDFPAIDVVVGFPGASPETMANTVATPLEKEFMTITGITFVTSTNMLGNTNIVLQFDISKSMDSAAQDVEAAISRSKAKLPPDLPNDPTFTKVNPSDTPIIYMALTSNTMTLSDLYTYANIYIGQQLSMINGVAQVVTYGSPYAVRVQVNPNTLANLGITLEDVAGTIMDANPYLPIGQLNGTERSPTIVAKGQLITAVKYNPLIVAYRNNSPVRIQNVGHAIDGLQNDKMTLRYVDAKTDQPTVVLAIQRQPGANTVKVADAIYAHLPKLEAQLPASVDLKIIFDKSLSIKESVAEVEMTLLIAFALVVLVIFFYLGNLRDTIIPTLILPMSIVGTFIFMYLLDYSIDNLSLLALILAIGFIIDDAIVVLENIVRRVEQGESPWVAAIKGSQQIGFTILSMTLSLVAVFIPMVFMGGLIGKIFQEFAITLVIITLISGVISLTLTPMLCSRLIKAKTDHKPGILERFANALNNGMIAAYKPVLNFVLDHRWIALVVGLGSILVSGYYFYKIPKDFMPDDDIGFMMAFTQSEEGTSASRMSQYQSKVTKIIQNDPSVESFVSLTSYQDHRDGIIFIKLKPRHERPPITQIMQGMYGQLMFIPGINTYLKNIPLIDLSVGSDSKGSYQYTLQSMDLESLYKATDNLVEKLNSIAGFQGVTSDMEVKTPQLHIEVLRDQAATLGVSAKKIQETLQLAYAGGRVARIETPLDQYDVILEVEPRFQKKLTTLAEIYVRSDITNELVPLSAVATWKEGVGSSKINHTSQFPSTTVSFSLAPNIPLGSAIEQLKEAARVVLPANVIGSVHGAAETFEASMSSTYFLLLIAVLAIYVVLGILYESFIHPLTILSTLPPATFGALITLEFFGFPLSLYAFLGIILLIGIVKKNGIMMVDYALENERMHNQSPRDAIFNACIVRFRPIMMTTVTAIMGAVPIALAVGSGAESRRPLGIVIIGGLMFSQLITLFITPAIYLYLDRLNNKFSFKVPEDAAEALETIHIEK
ncbi:MAG: efflux RND transporter permease subunit [Parachlamydiaceae bacterium]|nr:efflux RND transporter permease subunit [Parachlamydiaceae bacterium]